MLKQFPIKIYATSKQLQSFSIEYLYGCMIILNQYKMQDENDFSRQEPSSHLNVSESSQEKLIIPKSIQSKIIFDNSQRRQVDHLYQNICERNLSPKQWLQQVKSDKNVRYYNNTQEIGMEKIKSRNQISNKSFQDEIVKSNYRQLLRNQFSNQFAKDQQLHEVGRQIQEQERQNIRIQNQNTCLRRQMARIKKREVEREQKFKELDSNFKKLTRRYENLLKQSEAKENNYKAQIQKLRKEKRSYQNLAEALKESIHILKGKKVNDLSQIWHQWKHIFQLASLQQCKLTKNRVKP